MSVTIGSIVVDLLARTGSFETDLNRSAKLAEKRAKEIDAAIAKAGAAVGVAFAAAGAAALAFGRQVADGLDALNDVKDATGASIANISALEDVALRTGASMDTVSGILIKFNAGLKEADGKNGVSLALKAIGLDAAELRKEDPAEALRKTAVALSQFADDGDRARAIQELFGKSVREAAPFLNDLAEKTKLVGTVTDEQTAAAERFNKQLFEMQKNSLDAARAIASDLLPAISRLLAEMSEGRKVFGSFFGAFVELGLKANPFDTWSDGAKKAQSDVERLTGEIDRLSKGGRLVKENAGGAAFLGPAGGDAARSRLAAAHRELDSAQKRKTYYDSLIAKQVAPEAQRLEEAFNGGAKPSVGSLPKPASGGKKDNSAAQEAAKQLTADLDAIKRHTEELKGGFDNREKVLAAQRAASLISEKDYYDQKRKLQAEGDQAEIAGLQKEIDRLKQEQSTLSGKEAIDNQRKIDNARAALRKAEADAATGMEVLNIEAKGSVDRITAAYEEARASAQSFFDLAARTQAMEIAGFGRGQKSRDFDAAIAQIEQTYEQRRQDLERDNRNKKFEGRKEDYDREVKLIEEFRDKSIKSYKEGYAQLEEVRQSFTLGAAEGLRNYFDETQDVFSQSRDVVTNAFKGMEDALVDFVKTGKLDFKSLVDSIIGDVARLVIRSQITGPLAGMINEALGGGRGKATTGFSDVDRQIGLSGGSGLSITGGSSGFGDILGGLGSLVGRLFGGAFANGGEPPLGKISLVGERGPEWFVPKTAGRILPNHLIGQGGGRGQSVVVNINNSVGDIATLSQLKAAQAGTERRIAAAFERSQRYGGA